MLNNRLTYIAHPPAPHSFGAKELLMHMRFRALITVPWTDYRPQTLRGIRETAILSLLVSSLK